MKSVESLVWPCVALVLWTALVWALALRDRLAEMRRRRIHPQTIARPAQVAATLTETRRMDNFNHLLQMPMLFYVLCLALMQLGLHQWPWVAAAWGYVALRVVHSLIQIGRNVVLHRLYVFVASSVLLWGLWAALAVCLLC